MSFLAQSYDPKGSIKDRINKYETYVNNTLKLPHFNALSQVPDISQICLGIMSKETHFVPTFMNGGTAKRITDGFAQAVTSRKVYEVMNGTPDILYNAFIDPLNMGRPQSYFVLEVIIPHGLGQVMGYHFCQDLYISVWDKKTRKNIKATTYIKGFGIVPRVDGSSFTCSYKSPAGTINNMFSGPNGEEDQVRASMIVLNDKYVSFQKSVSGKIEAINLAVRNYLGSGMDANKTTPEVYLADVRGFNKNNPKGGSTGSGYSTQLAQNVTSKDANITKPCGEVKVA